MKYIKSSNDGVLDVVAACSMLGASVKMNKEKAIGMYGTGLKYALALAARMGIELHIASGDNVFVIQTTQQNFRDVTFTKVCLKNIHTGEVFETPITTEFGNHDWVDKWNIYREIVCNSMDEKGYALTVVNDIRRTKDKTSIYMKYDDFGKFYENRKEYFCEAESSWIKKGTGIIYKKGVRVGSLNGLNLDVHSNDISISEAREVSMWSAHWVIGQLMSKCEDIDTWIGFLESDKKKDVSLQVVSEVVSEVLNKALKKVHGDYAICPAVDHVMKDLLGRGVYPFVMASNWTFLHKEKFTQYTDLFSINESVVREPNASEAKMVAFGLGVCESFGMNFSGKIKVFEKQDNILGLADLKVGDIWLHEKVFLNKREFLKTLLEEVGHSVSGYHDYTREFTEFFIGKMVDLAIK